MIINVEIDDELLTKALKLGKVKTKKAIIHEALKLFVAIKNQSKLAELYGKVKLDDEAFK